MGATLFTEFASLYTLLAIRRELLPMIDRDRARDPAGGEFTEYYPAGRSVIQLKNFPVDAIISVKVEINGTFDTPIATGEMLTSALEHGELIRHRAADYLMPDAPRVGGITPFLKIAAQAEAASLMLAPHFAMELHVHLAAAFPSEPWVEHFDWLEPLFNERIVPLASPAFVREHKLRRIEQLLEVPLIQSNVSVVQWSDWFAAFSNLRAPERFTVRFDRAQMSLDAATQGLGVALESATNAAGHLADGKLKAVFGLDQAIRVKAHFAVYPQRHAKRPAVEAFLGWLHKEAAQE